MPSNTPCSPRGAMVAQQVDRPRPTGGVSGGCGIRLSQCRDALECLLDPRPWFGALAQTTLPGEIWADCRRPRWADADPPARRTMLTPYPTWLNPGDNAWQLTAATLVGLMSVPGLVVLYGGVMQKRWSINSMMLTFATFAIVLIVWVLWAFKMGFGHADRPSAPGSSRHSSGSRATSSATRPTGPGVDPVSRCGIADVPIPALVARVLPVRVRGDHPDPGARLRTRTREHQGVDSVHRPVDHVRLRGRRVPALGRWLVRAQGCDRLLGWLRDPPVGRCHGVRGGGCDRASIADATARSTRRTTC